MSLFFPPSLHGPPISGSKATSAELDLRLVQAAINGEEEAFVQLYHQHIGPLYGFIFKKVNDRSNAEDLVSETFLQALKNLPRFSGKSTFKNWLYGIAKHLILAHYREKYNESTVELEENSAATFPEKIELEEEIADAAQKENSIAAILGALPRNYRNVLELRFLKGYTIIETAKELGISEENAKVLQHRALKKANQITPH